MTVSAAAIRGDDCGYLAFHAPRYALLLRLLGDRGLTAGSTVLDIGPSPFTRLLHERFGATVDTLGFPADHVSETGRHFQFDLNHAQHEQCWRRDLPTYDFVILAEVIEHLHTAPELVLAFIKSLLTSNGLLILQTPNAAALPKRVKLLLGRHPYDRLRVDPLNPGHFREYTRAELHRLASQLDFRVEESLTASYFDARFARHHDGQNQPTLVTGSLKNALYGLLPTGLREGITMLWRKSA